MFEGEQPVVVNVTLSLIAEFLSTDALAAGCFTFARDIAAQVTD
jgi:hypothetical protein